MKLLVVNEHGLSGGGTEGRLRTLLTALVADRWWDAIHVLQWGSNDARVEGVEMHVARDARDAYDQTRRFIAGEGIDVVQAHNMAALNASPLAAAHAMGVPAIWFAHDYWGFCGRRILVDRWERTCSGPGMFKCSRCLSIADALHLARVKPILQQAVLGVAASHALIRWYEGNGMLKGRWRRVVPWLDPAFAAAPATTARDTLVLFVGPLASYKGALTAVEAMRTVSRIHPKWRLRFIGGEQEPENPHRRAVEQAAGESTLVLEFGGFKRGADLAAELARAGMYVCPPRWPEPFGLTWAEAMRAGLPVVATQVGGLPEYLEGRAVLVPPDNPAALAAGICRVIEQPAEAARLGAEGQRYAAQEFGVARAVKEMKRIYAEVLGKAEEVRGELDDQ